jgi:hypothetical protein
MRFKVEIEARQANFELWILSTLVFIHFSRHAFASFLSIQFSKIIDGLIDHLPIYFRRGKCIDVR